MGEGRTITVKHLVKLGKDAKLTKGVIDRIIEQTRHALAQWTDLSKEYEVSKTNAEYINRMISKSF